MTSRDLLVAGIVAALLQFGLPVLAVTLVLTTVVYGLVGWWRRAAVRRELRREIQRDEAERLVCRALQEAAEEQARRVFLDGCATVRLDEARIPAQRKGDQ